MRAGDDPDLSPVPGGLRVHEAGERARLLTIEDYDVRLDFSESPRSARFESHTQVTFSCSVAVASSWIDLIAAEVVHVELNGVVLDPRRVVKPGRVLLDGLATRNVLVVRAVHFAAEGRAVGRGLSRSVDPSDGAVYLWSQCEAFDARRIFACFDQPDLKATIRLTVTAPPGWSCVSNGTGTVTAGGENHTWRFSPTPPLPTYVFAICAGPFCRVESTDPGVPIRLHARHSLEPHLQAEAVELLATTRRGLAYYAAEFGVPYPGDSYDYVFLPDFGGAMENFGCVCWTDEVIYRRAPTPLERHLRMIILLHEMAHMWFGNLVTMRWWDGLWLNESFADWAAFRAVASLDSGIDGWATFLHLRKRLGYRADQAPTTHPVSGFVADVAHAEAIVDMITYAKGASVLRQLTALVGEAAFRQALRQYFRKLAWRNAELGDLLSEVEAAAGIDLKAWAHDWLETSGTSTLVLDVEQHDGGYRTVTVRQRSGAGFPDLREHRLNLGVYDRDGAGRLTRRQRIAVHATASGAVDELSGRPLAELLLPNDDDLDFVKLRVDERSLPALMHPGRLPDARARAVALGVLDDMMRDGELPASAVLAAISGCLEVEESPVQVQLLLALADEIVTLWTPAGYRRDAMAALADICRGRLDATLASHPLARVHRLGFGQLSATPAQLDLVARMLAREPHDQAFRWTCLERLASASRASDDDIDAEAGRDPDPDAVVKAQIVRSARGTRAAKDLGIALMFGNEPLARTQRRHLSKAFWQPLQARLLGPYLESYLQRMWQRLEAGDDDALHIAVVEFPVHCGAPAQADLHRLAADNRVPARSHKALVDHLDLIERARRAHSLAAGRASDNPNAGAL